MTSDTKFWINRKDAALLVGISLPTFDVLRAKFPDDASKPGKGREVLFDSRKVVRAFVDREIEQAADPMLVAGADSPALERYREARADRAELELQKMRRSHIDIKELDGTLHRFTNQLRGTGELLQRRFGSDASDIFNGGIIEASEILTKDLLSNGNGNA
jgi:phage terminase Nu1 subunit (DNA packaging protein)